MASFRMYERSPEIELCCYEAGYIQKIKSNLSFKNGRGAAFDFNCSVRNMLPDFEALGHQTLRHVSNVV